MLLFMLNIRLSMVAFVSFFSYNKGKNDNEHIWYELEQRGTYAIQREND